MAIDKIWCSTNVQTDFPTHDDIVNRCANAGFNRNGVSIRVAGSPRYWVKYGSAALMRGEGRTQAPVAEIVNANTASVVRIPRVYFGFSREKRGYLVMDFVRCATIAQRKASGSYEQADIEAAAAAVLQLTNIRMPADTAPGPVGGGRIGHDIFVDCLSALVYETVNDLEAHINRVLRLFRLRVDFRSESVDGLVLCLSDPNDSNFIVDDEGNLWVIDFGRTCFLPPSFVSYFLSTTSDVFVHKLAQITNYPQSANLGGIDIVSGRFINSGNNALGKLLASV